MGRLETRLERLEAATPDSCGMPNAVVRYNPGEARGWLPDMIAQLGWPSSLEALVTIDAGGEIGAAPTVFVPPLPDRQLTGPQHALLAHAGREPGPWWIAVAGRGWAEAVPMPRGQSALMTDLRRQRDGATLGNTGEL